MKTEEEIYQEMSVIHEIINKEEFKEALDSLHNLETNYPDSLTIRLNRIGFLVDIGLGLENPEIVEEGLVEVVELLQEDTYKDSQVTIHYNAANGYLVLHQLKNKGNRTIEQLVENEDLQKAKGHFREALKSVENIEPELRKQIWTNYGNCLDSLGRTMEALYAYDEVLKIDPCFSMAFGNKAMALRFFADISGAYREAMYIKSFQMMKSIIENDDLVRFGGVASKKRFENEIKIIEELFENRGDLYQNLEHPLYDLNNATDFEKFYINFCSEHKLFLNFHIHEDNCEASIVDPIFPDLIMPVSDTDSYENLAKYINQIKEDYMVARLLLVQSQVKREDFNRISRRTTFVNTSDYSIFNIYVGLLKSAFKEAYNILDKIAVFINRYYKIGLKEKDTHFYSKEDKRCVWRKNNKIRKEILKSSNVSLYALYDIFLDFDFGYYKQFQKIRNALTHRNLCVYEFALTNFGVDDDIINIGYETMLHQTIELLQLVKSSIIYLMNFVQLEENKKMAASASLIPPIYADTTQFL